MGFDYLEIVRFLHKDEYQRNPPAFNERLFHLEMHALSDPAIHAGQYANQADEDAGTRITAFTSSKQEQQPHQKVDRQARPPHAIGEASQGSSPGRA